VTEITTLPTGVTEVVGSIPTWNSEIFSAVAQPVAKPPSFAVKQFKICYHNYYYIDMNTGFFQWEK